MFPDPSETFLICTPPFRRSSAGVVVLHELAHQIISSGKSAYHVFFDPSSHNWFLSNCAEHYSKNLSRQYVDFAWALDFIRRVLDQGVTVYPEIVVGNPLGAKRVVRYFLNEDGAVTGANCGYERSEYILSYDAAFFACPNMILCKPITDAKFNDFGALPAASRSFDLTYFGKRQRPPGFTGIVNSITLTREWPENLDEYAVLLRNARYVYAWDCVSSVLVDAVLCGAVVVLIDVSDKDQKNLMESNFPYNKGSLIDDNILVDENPLYNIQRSSYLKTMTLKISKWPDDVQAFVGDVSEFFLRG